MGPLEAYTTTQPIPPHQLSLVQGIVAKGQALNKSRFRVGLKVKASKEHARPIPLE